jgi:hypothetical protein
MDRLRPVPSVRSWPHSAQGSQLHRVFLRQDSTHHALENPYSGPTQRSSPLCTTGPSSCPPEGLRRLTYSTTLVSGPSTLQRLHTPVGTFSFPSTLPLNFYSPKGGGSYVGASHASGGATRFRPVPHSI